MVYKNCILPNGDKIDIEVKDGVIIKIGDTLRSDDARDLEGAYIVPKLVDLNVRLKDAVLSSTTIKQCAKEAKKGGVGTLVLQPDSTPRIDNEIVLEFAQNSIKDIDDVEMEIAIDALQEDLSLSNIAILLKKGAVAPRMSTIAKNNIAMKVAEYVKMYKKPLLCKAEDNSLISQGVMFEGDVSSKLGLAGIPELSEVVHVSRMIEIARYYDIAILFQSVASPRSLDMITKAKEEGVRVSAEVSLHHLMLSDKACEDFNTTAKLNPPLVDERLKEELVAALKDGCIDVLTQLHQPSSPVNKEVAFFDAAYGSSALGDAWPLYYTKLVKSAVLTLEEVIALTVNRPLALLGKEPVQIETGAKIDQFLALDLNGSYKVDDSNSLYNGETINATVVEF